MEAKIQLLLYNPLALRDIVLLDLEVLHSHHD